MGALRGWCSGVAVAVFFCALSSHAQQTLRITGWMTDTVCGAKGANVLHIDCAKRKVASGKAKYALYDERAKRLYILADQQLGEHYAGQRVEVTGTVSPSPIRRAGESLDPTTNRVVTHDKALDSTTVVAGVLSISSISAAPTSR